MTGAFALFAKWFGAKIKTVIARKYRESVYEDDDKGSLSV